MKNSIAKQAFENASKLYKTYKNAKRVIDSIEDGQYKWEICATEFGQFFHHIILNTKNCDISFHYFINKGCCVTVTN